MHSNNYVLAVKDSNHKVLREIAGKVYLPFNSEYSLLFKNDNPFRACVSVSIDGTDVLGSDELLLRPYSSLDLERFIVDGDKTKGNRFKFVPVSDSQVQDPSSAENGLIEVKFWKEIQRPSFVFTPPPYLKSWPTDNSGMQPTYMTTSGSTRGGSCISGSMGSSGDMKFACNASQSTGIAGATVPGSISHQNFTTTSFEGKDGPATVIRLQLMGKEEAVTVEKTKRVFCVACGKGHSYLSNFCSKCGIELQKTII